MSTAKGKRNDKANTLTRRSGDLPGEGDLRLTQQYQTFLKPVNIGTICMIAELIPEPEPTEDGNQEPDQQPKNVEKIQNEDAEIQRFNTMIRQRHKQSKEINLSECSIKDNIVVDNSLPIIPDNTAFRLKIREEYHDSQAAVDPGRDRTHNYYQGTTAGNV